MWLINFVCCFTIPTEINGIHCILAYSWGGFKFDHMLHFWSDCPVLMVGFFQEYWLAFWTGVLNARNSFYPNHWYVCSIWLKMHVAEMIDGYLGQCRRHGLFDFIGCLCFFLCFESRYWTPGTDFASTTNMSVVFLLKMHTAEMIDGYLGQCWRHGLSTALATFACKRKPLTVYFLMFLMFWCINVLDRGGTPAPL